VRFLKILAFAQALVIVYLLRENLELKEQLVNAADVMAKATDKIEKLNGALSDSQVKESTCRYVLNKYIDQTYVQPQPQEEQWR
jgi:septal ring factor EnvC (AmiA/AmiB activator)